MAEEKILKEENLSEEELEQVAGGDSYEISEDVRRFKSLGISIDNEELLGTPSRDIFYALLTMEFKKHGVKYVHSSSNPNQYFINDKKVSQDEAWKHIYSKLKK